MYRNNIVTYQRKLQRYTETFCVILLRCSRLCVVSPELSVVKWHVLTVAADVGRKSTDASNCPGLHPHRVVHTSDPPNTTPYCVILWNRWVVVWIVA